MVDSHAAAVGERERWLSGRLKAVVGDRGAWLVLSYVRVPDFSLRSHTAGVLCAAFSPGMEFVASGSQDRTCKVFNVGSKRLVRTLSGHKHWVTAVTFGPTDGTSGGWPRVVTGTQYGVIRIWNLREGAVSCKMEFKRSIRTGTSGAHCLEITALRMSDEGHRLVSASRDMTVKVWSFPNGRLLRTLEGHTHGINSISVSPGWKRIVSASVDGTVRVWRARDGECRFITNVFKDLQRRRALQKMERDFYLDSDNDETDDEDDAAGAGRTGSVTCVDFARPEIELDDFSDSEDDDDGDIGDPLINFFVGTSDGRLCKYVECDPPENAAGEMDGDSKEDAEGKGTTGNPWSGGGKSSMSGSGSAKVKQDLDGNLVVDGGEAYALELTARTRTSGTGFTGAASSTCGQYLVTTANNADDEGAFEVWSALSLRLLSAVATKHSRSLAVSPSGDMVALSPGARESSLRVVGLKAMADASSVAS